MTEVTEIFTASAFSKDGRGGNQAGVVVQDAGLDDKEKSRLANRLGYSETVFLSNSELADVRLAYFTPTGEVPLCGHATIAAFVVLNHLNRLDRADYVIETKSGVFHIKVDWDGLVFMEQNRPEYYDILDKGEVEGCFDIDAIDRALPVQIVSTGLRDILIPIKDEANLKRLVPNLKALSRLSRERDVVGVHAFALTKGGPVTAICRNFAPLYGIDEESATGTSNCALACYLYRYGQRHTRYLFEQGHLLNSVSRIHVEIKGEGPDISRVFVGGYGYMMNEGRTRTVPLRTPFLYATLNGNYNPQE